MKPGIIIVGLAALALAIVATPDTEARAWWGWHGSQTMNLRVAGSNFITSNGADGMPTTAGEVSTSLQSGISKGSGSAVFSSQTIIAQVRPNMDDLTSVPPRSCATAGLAGAELSTTIVVTYRDGSILSLVTGPGSIYCTNGSDFFVDFGGTVEGGEGRYEGASGTWEGSAESHSPGRVTGQVSIELD